MTTTTPRPQQDRYQPDRVPSHPHYTMGSVLVTTLLVAVGATIIGIVGLMLLADHDSVDQATVSALVDQKLASVETPVTPSEPPAVDDAPPVTVAPSDSPIAFGDILPELTPKAQLPIADGTPVSYAPNVPDAPERNFQAIVEVEFEVVEQVQTIDPTTGIEFETWGFRIAGDDQTISTGTPGPMVRARVGDVLRFIISNPATNLRAHNVDFHAVTGQGGGAADTTVAPGETAVIEARMLYPGMFMYHCAAGDVPAHIAHGMYGGILVDPVTPLPAADAEFYVVQSEYYLTGSEGEVQELDRSALTDEHPTMVVFNGSREALTGDNALTIDVGDRARIYFINAGLNLDSNFHPIGSHWDAVWPEGALLNEPLRGSQTTLVPAGGGVVVDLVGQVPSNIILVDHALTRAFDKGAIGIVSVIGDPDSELFEAFSGEPPAVAEPDVTGQVVDILPGSWEFQEQPADDEFAETESIPDYSVNVLRVPVGTTVTWLNQDEQMHTVTAVDGSFDSGFLAQGETFAVTFDSPGEFEYACTPHPWMLAKVIVEG